MGSARRRKAAKRADKATEETTIESSSKETTTQSKESEKEQAKKLPEYIRKDPRGAKISFAIPNAGLNLNPWSNPNPIKEEPGVSFWTLLLKRKENKRTLHKLVAVSCCMLILPLLVFFALDMHLMQYPDFSRMDRMMYSGFASVLAVNVVIYGFVLYAFFEPCDPEEPEEEPRDEPKGGAPVR